MRGKREEKRYGGRFMKLCISVVILQVIAYTWMHLILSKEAGLELTPVTSAAFYGFCGFEAGICGWIKREKEREKCNE